MEKNTHEMIIQCIKDTIKKWDKYFKENNMPNWKEEIFHINKENE